MGAEARGHLVYAQQFGFSTPKASAFPWGKGKELRKLHRAPEACASFHLPSAWTGGTRLYNRAPLQPWFQPQPLQSSCFPWGEPASRDLSKQGILWGTVRGRAPGLAAFSPQGPVQTHRPLYFVLRAAASGRASTEQLATGWEGIVQKRSTKRSTRQSEKGKEQIRVNCGTSPGAVTLMGAHTWKPGTRKEPQPPSLPLQAFQIKPDGRFTTLLLLSRANGVSAHTLPR